MGSLDKEFENTPKNAPGSNTEGIIRQSIAIINAVDKLKAQGIPVTKKAELDYLLALRFLEKNKVSIPAHDEEPEETIVKRTPKDNPREFEIAMEFSRKTVEKVEELLNQGVHVPEKKLEEYELCKKFLKKWGQQRPHS